MNEVEQSGATSAGRPTSKSSRRRRGFLLGLFALSMCVLFPAASQAANPSIINTGTGCTGQTAWLVSCATAGEQPSTNPNILRISALVSHDAGNSIASLITDDDWDGTVDPTTVRTVTATRPSIASGYPRSRVNLSYQLPTSNTGMSCGPFSFTRRTSDRNARFQARDSAGQTSGASSSLIKFVAAGTCTTPEDYAFLYGWAGTNFGKESVPGASQTYTYNGDDSDSSGNSDFQGINWRYRNLRTGATTTATLSCPGGGDNSTKTLTANAPATRGAYVLEAELRDGSGCTQDQNPGYWFPIGTVDVNSATIPAPTVTATDRPQTNGNVTVTVDPPTDPDSANGGGPQIIQWDLDQNTGNGVSGFEVDSIAGEGATFTTNQTKTINTTGKAPGTYTVRARVIDNGAMDAADAIRRTSSTATATFTVNSPPAAANQTVSTETAEAKAITLSATDANNDALTYTIVSGPSNGTLTGTGANRTYTSNANFAGTDSFVFKADDGFGGTSNGTVTINVAPQTQIDSGPSGTTGPNPSFEFSSPVSGASFECSLDNAAFTPCSSPKDYTGLSGGQHTFQVRAIAAGFTDPTPASRTFTVDATPPETTIDSGPAGPTLDSTPEFTFSSSEAGSTFECRVDAGAFQGCTSPHETEPLSFGSHTFEVRATDPYGNVDPTPASRAFVVLNAAEPETTIDSGPSGRTDDPTPTFEFSSSIPGSSFECRIDGGTFTACTSPYTTEPLNEGQHTFEVRAISPAGNEDPTPATRDFVVDTVAPETTITDGPSDLTKDSTPTFQFTSDEAGSTFECSLDAGNFAPCESPYTTTPLDDGQHTFEVRATDPTGITDQSPASRTFTVDATDPQTTIDSGPSGLTNDPTPTFEFSSDEAGATFQCRIDAAAFTSCDSPKTYGTLADGQHTFEVRATDPAGNTDGSPASRTFTVDATAPQTTIDSGPANPTNDRTPTFEFSSSEPGSSFECSLDGAAFATCTSPETTASLSDGQHTFEVRATDPAGNTDQTPASRTFTVDATDPQTTIDSGPSGLTNDPTPTFEFSSDEAGATFQCRIDAAAFTSCDSPKTYGTLADGQHTFEVRATDPAGNTDGSPASRTFTVDATAPQTTIDSGPANPTNDRTPTFEFSSSEPGSSFECSLDGAAFATCTSPETTASLSDGQHTFEVRATDSAGNTDGSPASRTFTVDATAPQTTIDSGPSQDERIKDATPTFSFSSNENGATFECSVDGAPFASCESPLTTDQLADGTHAFAVRATDGAGNVDGSPASRSFIVDTVAPETTIDSGPSGITDDSTATFAFSSPDPSPSFECRFDGDAFSSCGSPHTSGSLDDGEHTFYVRALDEAGNADESPASRTFIVDTADPQTAIDSGPPDLTNDRTPTFEFSSDEASSTFQCRLDGGSYSSCSSPHTTGQLADGSHTFEVRATDPAGNTDESPATWTFTVDATEPRTTIESGPSEGQRINETRPQFAFRSDEPGSTFECRVDADAFAACDSPYTTAPLADGQHTFEVRATDAAGNVEEPPAARTFTVDVTAPETSIDSGPEGQTNERRPSFGFSSSEPDSTFKCRMDADAFQPCDSPFRPEANLSEGSHTFEVRATDAATNPDPTPASRSFTVDVDVPTTAITFGPASTTTDTTPTFQFASDTSDARFECRIDSNAGADFFDCDSPYTLDELDEGPHNFEVRAIDQAGNADPTPASRTFTVAREPDTVIESGPREVTNDPTPTFEFSSSKPKSSFECRLDSTSSADFAPCDSPFTAGPLDDGRHTLDVRAVDQYETRDRSPASRTFTVDTAAPNTEITAEPGDSTSDRTPTWEFESSEEGSSFECRMDDGAFAVCDSPYTAETLSDGPHRFAVRAVDAAGNADPTPATSTFTVDSSRSAKAFSLGKVKLNRDKGTATLAVHLPEAGKVSLGGRGIRGRSKLIPSARTVKLRILAKGRRARRLEERGSVSVRAKVTFNPDDGPPATKSKRVKLHKRP